MSCDPFYEKILERLSKLDNGNLFEQCVSDLLRAEWPTLIPVSGGDDAGVDGAWADARGQGLLIATIQKDVLANVRKSLESHNKANGNRRYVLVATSQHLSPRRCRNIERRVQELGFELVHHPYTQSAIADRIYHNSRWCKQLLGLSGQASALARIPIGIRPLRDVPLVGREEDLDWLLSTSGDRLLIGQPGIGKTYLAQAFVNKGCGLFVIEDDINRLADAIRDQQPAAAVIEDAHLRLDVIGGLRHLRANTGAAFDIVADCWPGVADSVCSALSLSQAQCRELKPLHPEQIVELIHAAGIGGPDALIHQLVRQSLGCPGRAALLAHICFSEDVGKVWDGQELTRWTRETFSHLIGERAVQMLAAFALGGSRGMPIDAIAEILGYPSGEVRQCMAKLAMGGVVQDVGDAAMFVLPEPLRCVLVRDYFFSQPAPLQLDRFLSRALDRGSALCTLMGAYARGATISSYELLHLLESTRDPEAWENFVWCDSKHAHLLLDKHPEKADSLFRPLLYRAPERTIPLLLEKVIDDEQHLNTASDDPLRVIDGWISSAEPGLGEAVKRRTVLLDSLIKWLGDGRNQQIGLRALRLALSPSFEDHQQDPGKRHTFTMRRGVLTLEELKEVAAMWARVRDSLQGLTIVDWTPVITAIDQWVYQQGRAPVKLTEEYHEVFRDTARRMLHDVAKLASGRPGVSAQLNQRAKALDVKLAIDIDPDFAILFPEHLYSEEWEERRRRQLAAAEGLASRWITKGISRVADKLAWCVREAKTAGIRDPDYSWIVCGHLAKASQTAVPWTDALIAAGLDANHIEPFLEKASANKEEGWQERAAECLRRDTLRNAGVPVLLKAPDVTEDILNEAIKRARELTQRVEVLCFTGKIEDDRIARLLEQEYPEIAEAAAIGLWLRHPEADIPGALKVAWQRAVITHVKHKYQLCEIMRKDHELAFAWLLDRALREVKPFRVENQVIAAASSVLTVEQKRLILQQLAKVANASRITMCLVGHDATLYRDLLADDAR